MLHTTRVIAIDPGYGRLGVAILEKKLGKEILVHSECLETDKTDAHPERLSKIQKRLSELLGVYKPSALAIEKLYFGKNKKTALLVAEARGTVISEASSRNIPVFEYDPSQVKISVTGYGNSDKKQIQNMVSRILKLEKKIAHDDEYDAIAIGLTHFAIYRAEN